MTRKQTETQTPTEPYTLTISMELTKTVGSRDEEEHGYEVTANVDPALGVDLQGDTNTDWNRYAELITEIVDYIVFMDTQQPGIIALNKREGRTKAERVMLALQRENELMARTQKTAERVSKEEQAAAEEREREEKMAQEME